MFKDAVDIYHSMAEGQPLWCKSFAALIMLVLGAWGFITGIVVVIDIFNELVAKLKSCCLKKVSVRL